MIRTIFDGDTLTVTLGHLTEHHYRYEGVKPTWVEGKKGFRPCWGVHVRERESEQEPDLVATPSLYDKGLPPDYRVRVKFGDVPTKSRSRK